MDHDTNLQRQLAMLPSTWQALLRAGVGPTMPLALDFTYRAPSRAAAAALARDLGSCSPELAEGGAKSPGWFVLATAPAAVYDQVSLTEWVTHAVGIGWRHGCEFDGFGAQVP